MRVALVTGANRGIGYEAARQLARKGLHVILTSREEGKGRAASDRLKAEGLDVRTHVLDVASENSIVETFEFVRDTFGRLDVLVNNAGIFLDRSADEGGETSTAMERIRRTMETNVYGPFRLCELFLPLMKKNGYGRVVNVSSGMGQLSEMEGGYPSYRISKTALNAVTRIFAADFKGDLLVNSVCPGWVKTDMGGPDAERPVEKGAETIVWLATLPAGGPTGGFFRDREPIAW